MTRSRVTKAAPLGNEHSGSADIDQATLVASVDARMGVADGDLLLMVGSIAEGLGNHKSDIDLLLVAADRTGRRLEVERAWSIARRLVDVRIINKSTVDLLCGRLRQWVDRPWDLSELAPFSHDDRVLLHRLLAGVLIHPGSPGDVSWRPAREDLALLKLQVARHMARTIQIDMVGYRDAQDYTSLVFSSQDLVGHTVDGLLAGHHVTNPNPKWRSRLLSQLPPNWCEPLLTRSPTSADLQFWNLHRAPAEPERNTAISHAVRSSAFARDVFSWAEARLRVESACETPSGAAPSLGRNAPARPLPALEFDVDFRFDDDGSVLVARLNEFGQALRLNRHEFALLLMCDGRTSSEEVSCRAGGELGGFGEPIGVADTVSRIASHGLCLQSEQLRGDDG